MRPFTVSRSAPLSSPRTMRPVQLNHRYSVHFLNCYLNAHKSDLSVDYTAFVRFEYSFCVVYPHATCSHSVVRRGHRYGQHSFEGNILGKDLTLHPAERENYMLTRLKADLATKNICEQKRELGTVCRFDDAMSYRVKTFDLPLQVTPSWLGR